MKTNAVRQVEAAGVRFELRNYELDQQDLGAETVAFKVGLPAEQVFKTRVVEGDRAGISLAVIPGHAELNLKAMAKATADRKCEMVAVKSLQSLTGYVRGSVTALACRKAYPVYVDETAILFDVISVCAGVRGLQILLHPEAYIRLVQGTFADIATPKV